MPLAWVLVGGAIVAEVCAAIMLRISDGFTKRVAAIAALFAFGTAFYLVSRALVDLPVSTVYPIWAGGGTAGVAVIGILVFKERAHKLKAIGVACVVAGIVVLNLASTGAT